MTNNNEEQKGRWRRFWSRLWQRPSRWWLFGVPVGGFVAFVGGILFWGSFHWSIEASNSLDFCTSCHEMDIVYEEYTQSTHFQNAAGVRAICTDCHVPHAWGPKIVRKIKATNELWHTLIGTIDTPEKFEAHRKAMAESVWEGMRKNNSLECRNCHSYEAMAVSEQARSAQRRHTVEWYERTGDTCIDCHQGIAHKLPEAY